MAIEFKKVTKSIKKNTVINNVSLIIESGKITGLQGINGSGKTMMAKCMASILPPLELQEALELTKMKRSTFYKYQKNIKNE